MAPVSCNQHPGEVRFYCSEPKCKKLICPDCFLQHNGHNIKAIQAAYEEQKENIVSLLSDIRKKRDKFSEGTTKVESKIQELGIGQQKIEEEINQYFKQVEIVLNERKTYLLADLKTKYALKLTQLNRQLTQLSSNRTSLGLGQEQAEELLKHNSGAQLLMLDSQLRELSLEIDRLNLPLEPEAANNIIFHGQEMKFFDRIGQLVEMGTVAAACTAIGDGLLRARVLKSNSFIITAKDKDGKPRSSGGDLFTVEISEKKGKEIKEAKLTIEDRKDGTYGVNYVLPEAMGECLIAVFHQGVHISGSPFRVECGTEAKLEVKFARKWGSIGTGSGQFGAGPSIGVSGAYVYVTDYETGRVQVFSKDGSIIRIWGIGKGPGGLAADGEYIYISDFENSKIRVYRSDGICLRAWGSRGAQEGMLHNPWRLAIARQCIYICDTGNSRVARFAKDGRYMSTWGTPGAGDGQFSNPQGIAVDAEREDVYVADTGNARIQVFDSDGKFLRKWGSAGSGVGQLSIPRSLSISGNYVFVCDSTNNNIQVFEKSGKWVYDWGTKGTNAGQLDCPYDLAINDNLLYVLEQGNRRVQVFSIH